MHRQTPLTSGFVGYTSGGSRTLIDTIDDDQLMQEMKGTMMQTEARQKVESPQNYGFTSVVREATKGKDGKIEDCAEGFMSYAGGNRSFSFCAVMDDRRYRPLGLKPGENAQYDDIAQMTLMRRTGLYLLTNDNPEDKQQSQSGGGATAGQHADSGSQNVERFVSVRHVEKKKQERPKRGQGQQQGGTSGGSGGASPTQLASGGQSQSKSKDYKHEGETVNLEMRVSKKRIEFRSGDTVVGYYDKGSATWCFIGKVKLGAEDAQDPIYGNDHTSGKGNIVDKSKTYAAFVKAELPGPPTALDAQP